MSAVPTQPPAAATTNPTPAPAPRPAPTASTARRLQVPLGKSAVPPAGATAQGALPAANSGRMSLAKVVKGRLAKPVRVMVYGPEGVGKSTFAAGAPVPIFLGAEDGTSELDIARFPQPRTWTDALEAVAELTTAQHEYQSLVIDTMDWLEPMCWAHVCATKRDKQGKLHADIEGFGYGKGYTAALDEWRRLTVALERLRNERGMHVVLLAHSWIKPFKNPVGDDFDRYELKLHAKASGLLREWCDAVVFATHELHTYETDGRAKGIMSGARWLYTERCAGWDAKNRYDLPPQLPLDWEAFFEAVHAHRPADPATLVARIERMLELVASDTTLTERVRTACEQAKDDAAELARIASKLAARVDAAAAAAAESEDT